MTMRIATWNLERKKPESGRGAEAVDYLFEHDADVMVVTEARTSFPLRDGHALWCEPPEGTYFAPNERKVLIWSKEPWIDVDRVGVQGLDQTRFISATTDTPIRPIRVLGVCIPWHMAEVTYPIDVKRKPWELHIRYLEILHDLVHSNSVPTIIAGDFNQHIPRFQYGTIAAAAAMAATFQPFDVVTKGEVKDTRGQGVDHIAISNHLTANNVWGWTNDVTGNRLSDHDGAAADIALA